MPHVSMPTRAARTTLAGLVCLTALAGVAGTSPAGASQRLPVADQFHAGETYTGTFADPTVMRVGTTYVASATNVANLNLPVMTSPDLRTWTPRPALENYTDYSDWRGYNDAMPIKPTWAATVRKRDKVELMSQWAPSLAKVGDHFVAAYSAAVRLEPRMSCIGIARSDAALGLYRDRRSKPLVCFKKSPMGAIDPDVFVDPDTGKPWLMWKQEGIPHVQGPMLMARRLRPSGMAFKRGSSKHLLVRRDEAWEGSVVENPSMVAFGGRYYLLYSGNAWRTGDYATGYAVCDSPKGPCTKPGNGLLFSSGEGIFGPGGADAFVDADGGLRMAYAAWGAEGIGPDRGYRRMYVATLAADDDGRLSVTERR